MLVISSYTFRTMFVGTSLVGGIAGIFGSFLYLRRQALASDVIGHSAIFGVALAFIIATGVFHIEGRSMLVLTIGSVCSSTLAILLSNYFAKNSRLGRDATMAICLALFFGGGMTLIQVITHSTLTGRGGIQDYMFGNAATLTTEDNVTIAIIASLCLGIFILFWNVISVSIFDPRYAASLGFHPSIIEPLILGIITTGIVLGLKAVGLILIIAFALMPAVAAHQWVKSLRSMVIISGLIGFLGGAIGCYIAISLGKVPTGPIVVLVLTLIVCLSLLFSPRGSLWRALSHRRRITQLTADREVVA